MELGLFTFNMLNNNFVQSETTHDSSSWIPTRSNALKQLHEYSFLPMYKVRFSEYKTADPKQVPTLYT